MEAEIIPADKRHRKLVLCAAALLGLLGLLGLAILCGHLSEIQRLAEKEPAAAEGKMLRLATIMVWVGGLGLVGTGAWLWRLGRRINRAGRFPPPGMKVIKDTRVRTDGPARALASLAEAAAGLCVVAGTLGMWYLHGLVVALLQR